MFPNSNIDNYFNHLKQRKNKRRSGGLSAGTLIKHREGILRFNGIYSRRLILEKADTILQYV